MTEKGERMSVNAMRGIWSVMAAALLLNAQAAFPAEYYYTGLRIAVGGATPIATLLADGDGNAALTHNVKAGVQVSGPSRPDPSVTAQEKADADKKRGLCGLGSVLAFVPLAGLRLSRRLQKGLSGRRGGRTILRSTRSLFTRGHPEA
jgi:hypothetical protein